MVSAIERKAVIPEQLTIQERSIEAYRLANKEMVNNGTDVMRTVMEELSLSLFKNVTRVIHRRTQPVEINLDGKKSQFFLRQDQGEKPNGDPIDCIQIISSNHDNEKAEYYLNPTSTFTVDRERLETPDQFNKLQVILKAINESSR